MAVVPSAWLLIDSKRSERGMSKLNGACEGVAAETAMFGPLPITEAIMGGRADFVQTPQLDFEGWRAFLRASCGNQPEVTDPSAFAGWVRPLSVCGLGAAALKIECGLTGMDFGRNAYRSKRTHRDARFAGVDYYYAVFQVGGRSVLTQNDNVAQLVVGDVGLLDAAQPAACFAEDSQW